MMEIVIDKPGGYVGGDYVRGEVRVAQPLLPTSPDSTLSVVVCFHASQHVRWEDPFEEVDLSGAPSTTITTSSGDSSTSTTTTAGTAAVVHDETEEFVTKEVTMTADYSAFSTLSADDKFAMSFEVLLPQFSYASYHSHTGTITYNLKATLKAEAGEITVQREVPVLGSCDPISVENFAGVPTLSYTRSMPNNVGELTAKGALFKSWFHPGEAVAAMLDLENFPSTATSGGTLTCVSAALMQHQRFRSCNGSKLLSTALVSEANTAPLEPGFKECRLVSLSLPEQICATIKGSLVTIEYTFDLTLFSGDTEIMILSFPITIFPRKTVNVPVEYLYRENMG